MKRKNYLILSLFALVSFAVLIGCGSDTTTATSITLNKTTTTLYVGENDTLKATVVPTTAQIQTVTWSTSDSTIVTVDQNGIITALAIGEARVWALAQDGTPVKTGCNVIVADPDEEGDEDVDSLDVELLDSLGVEDGDTIIEL